MTFSVTIGSTEYDENRLEIFKLDYTDNNDIRLLITTVHEQDDFDGNSHEVTEGQAITVNYYALLRAIEAFVILPDK